MSIRHRLRNDDLLILPSTIRMQDSKTALAKYRYRRRLPHLQTADADLFVTFCAAGPLVLSAPARDLVLEHSLREGGILPLPAHGDSVKPRIHLHAVVIMPDHVHLLLQPLRSQDGWPYPLVDILQSLKSTTAHHINKRLDHLGPVWEEESFDHVLRTDESLKQKVEYIRQNPVRRGLVKRPEDYKWLWINPGLLNVARAPSPA